MRRAVLAALAAASLTAPAAATAEEGVTHYPVPTAGAYPLGIASGPDGALWFTEHERSRVGRIGTDGSIVEFVLESEAAGARPVEIVTGPDGALWLTQAGPDALVRVDTAGQDVEHPLPAGAPPVAIANGPGGLWYTRFHGVPEGEDGSAVGKMTTSGDVTQFPLPNGTRPSGIVAGPDGNLWVTARGTNQILRVTPSGDVTPFDVPTADSAPQGIAAGPDGALWFTERTANKVGRITTAGEISELALFTAGGGPAGIAPGPESTLWVTAFDGNFLARIKSDGRLEELPPLERAFSNPNRIVAGSDGAMWFTETGADTIGRVAPDAAAVPPPPPPPPPPIPPEPEPLPQPDYVGRAFRVFTADVRLSRKGKALLRIGCPADEAESCRGRVLLETADAISYRLGRAPFAVAPGRSETLAVKLNKKARRRLKRLGWLPVLATVTTVDRAGNDKSEEARFRLLAPKRRGSSRRRRK